MNVERRCFPKLHSTNPQQCPRKWPNHMKLYVIFIYCWLLSICHPPFIYYIENEKINTRKIEKEERKLNEATENKNGMSNRHSLFSWPLKLFVCLFLLLVIRKYIICVIVVFDQMRETTSDIHTAKTWEKYETQMKIWNLYITSQFTASFALQIKLRKKKTFSSTFKNQNKNLCDHRTADKNRNNCGCARTSRLAGKNDVWALRSSPGDGCFVPNIYARSRQRA